MLNARSQIQKSTYHIGNCRSVTWDWGQKRGSPGNVRKKAFNGDEPSIYFYCVVDYRTVQLPDS